MTRRAARRRRWKLAMGGIVVGGLVVAWWLRTGGALPPLDLQATAPPASVTAAAPAVVPGPVAVSRPAQPAPPATMVAPAQAQIAALDAAQARDEAWAAARRESIRVQQRLRAEAAEQRARRDALETDDEIRCIEGRRMRRVSNGWVDAGTC